MLRVLVTIVLPLITPTAFYLLWLALLRRLGRARRRATPWVWLAGAGVAVLAIVLFVVDVGFGTAQRGVYVPPQWRGGRIVPAHIAPAPSLTRGSTPGPGPEAKGQSRAEGSPARTLEESPLGGVSMGRGDSHR